MSLAQRCHWARLAIDAVLCGRVFWAETDPHSSLGIMCLVVPTYPSTHRLTAPLDAEEVDHAVMYMLDDIMGKTYLAMDEWDSQDVFHSTVADATVDGYTNSDGRTSILVTAESVGRMSGVHALKYGQWEVFGVLGKPLQVYVLLGYEFDDDGCKVETLDDVMESMRSRGCKVVEPYPGRRFNDDSFLRYLEVSLCYHPRLRWKLLRTRWLPNWRITNFWWRSAGEGQHSLGGIGAIRNRNEWEGDDLMPR